MSAIDPNTLGANYPLWTNFPNGASSNGFPQGGTIFTLTTAQLLALQTTAVTITPAPSAALGYAIGNGLVLIPKRVTLQYHYGGTAFTIGNADNAFRIQYTGKTTALFPTSGAGSALATGLVDQTTDTLLSVAASNVGALSKANCANLGFDIQLVGTAPALTLGNGTVTVNIRWTIVAIV